jgi:hypothetical protein
LINSSSIGTIKRVYAWPLHNKDAHKPTNKKQLFQKKNIRHKEEKPKVQEGRSKDYLAIHDG